MYVFFALTFPQQNTYIYARDPPDVSNIHLFQCNGITTKYHLNIGHTLSKLFHVYFIWKRSFAILHFLLGLKNTFHSAENIYEGEELLRFLQVSLFDRSKRFSISSSFVQDPNQLVSRSSCFWQNVFDKKINPWTMFEIGDTTNVSEKAEQSILKHVSQIEGGHIRMMRLQIETLPHCCHLASGSLQTFNITQI